MSNKVEKDICNKHNWQRTNIEKFFLKKKTITNLCERNEPPNRKKKGPKYKKKSLEKKDLSGH